MGIITRRVITTNRRHTDRSQHLKTRRLEVSCCLPPLCANRANFRLQTQKAIRIIHPQPQPHLLNSGHFCEPPLSPCPGWFSVVSAFPPETVESSFTSLSPPPPTTPMAASHLFSQPSAHKVMVHLNMTPISHYLPLHSLFIPPFQARASLSTRSSQPFPDFCNGQ